MDTQSTDSYYVSDDAGAFEATDAQFQQLLDESTKGLSAEEVEQQLDGLVKALKKFLKKKRPSLPVPCSEERCQEAVSNARHFFDVFLKEDLTPAQERLHDDLKSFLVGFRKLNELVESLWKTVGAQPLVPVMQELRDRKRVSACGERLDDLEMLLMIMEDDLATDYEIVFQSELKKMISKQSETFKSWFWADVGFSKHLKNRVTERPRVALSDGSTCNSNTENPQKTPGNSRILPLEIQTIIYSLVDDLETFVELRQVNSAWYIQFQLSEGTLKLFMEERNPWIEPGDGDLASWQDCALVFVTRLKRWTPVSTLDDIRVPGEPVPKTKTVLAMPLNALERLPDGFTPLVEHHAYCEDFSCEHFHSLSSYKIHVLNPRDYSLVPPDMRFDIQFHGSFTEEHGTPPYGNLYSFRGYEFLVSNDYPIHERVPIRLGRSTIVVNGREQSMVLPKTSGGSNYTQGISYASGDFWDDMEVGNVFFLTTSSYHDNEFQDEAYSIADFVHNKFVHYVTTADVDSLPVATYNGFIWWHMHYHTSLVPTFIDLQNPGKVYYKKDRIIRGPRMSQFKQGSKTFDASRFVVASKDKKMALYDLSTGIVTVVAAAEDSKRDIVRFFPGFVDGEFQPRSLTRAAERRMERLLRE